MSVTCTALFSVAVAVNLVVQGWVILTVPALFGDKALLTQDTHGLTDTAVLWESITARHKSMLCVRRKNLS